jgi:F-type H+-transporting ATPase subunit epsilon
MMRLILLTPLHSALTIPDVQSLRGEDATGAFGILPRHADFVTVLTVSVLSWRTSAGREGFAAVRGGTLTVSGGDEIRVATPEAVVADSLDALHADVLARLQREAAAETQARRVVERIEKQALVELAREFRWGSGARY